MNMLVTTTSNTGNTGLALNDGPTVLGERQARIPVGGKIRAGIKVLTGSASKHPQATPVYDAGVALGKSFSEIEKDLIQACGFERSPLTPRNVPYFTVRRSDFAMPDVADRIMALYAEDRGEGRHLYRFPVIFPVDAWQTVMPHSMRCYTRNELVYWSEYGPDGARYCKTRGKIEVDPRSKRAHRPYGGRPVVLRSEHEGRCEPEQCAEYQSRKCNLSGGLLFYVPGVPGSSAIELPTTSFYAMQQMRQQLEMVAFLRGGKISGTVDGRPIFYLAKKKAEVSMIDPETGQAKKVHQWIVSMEADIDMTRVFQAGEVPAALSAGEQAAHALEYHDEEFDMPGDVPGCAPGCAPGDMPGYVSGDVPGDVSEYAPGYAPGDISGDVHPSPEPNQENDPEPDLSSGLLRNDSRKRISDLRISVSQGLEMMGIPVEKYTAYAVKQWGTEWSRTLSSLERANSELVNGSPDSMKQKLRDHGVEI